MAQAAKSKKKTDTLKKLGEKLLFKKKSAWDGIQKKDQDEMFKLAESYKRFLDASKTEREAISTLETLYSWKCTNRPFPGLRRKNTCIRRAAYSSFGISFPATSIPTTAGNARPRRSVQ